MRTPWVLVVFAIAGCVTPSPTPTVSSTEATAPGYEGLAMASTLTSSGDHHRLDSVVTNSGPTTYQVSSICAPIFRDTVRDSQQKKVWPPDTVECLAYGTRPFPPGETLSNRVYWNETRDDPTSGATMSATAGTYEWTVVFHAGRSPDEGLPPALVTRTSVNA